MASKVIKLMAVGLALIAIITALAQISCDKRRVIHPEDNNPAHGAARAFVLYQAIV